MVWQDGPWSNQLVRYQIVWSEVRDFIGPIRSRLLIKHGPELKYQYFEKNGRFRTGPKIMVQEFGHGLNYPVKDYHLGPKFRIRFSNHGPDHLNTDQIISDRYLGPPYPLGPVQLFGPVRSFIDILIANWEWLFSFILGRLICSTSYLRIIWLKSTQIGMIIEPGWTKKWRKLRFRLRTDVCFKKGLDIQWSKMASDPRNSELWPTENFWNFEASTDLLELIGLQFGHRSWGSGGLNRRVAVGDFAYRMLRYWIYF